MNTAQEIGLPGPQAHRKDEAGSREIDTGIMMKRQSLGAREQNCSSVITMAVDPLIKKEHGELWVQLAHSHLHLSLLQPHTYLIGL